MGSIHAVFKLIFRGTLSVVSIIAYNGFRNCVYRRTLTLKGTEYLLYCRIPVDYNVVSETNYY